MKKLFIWFIVFAIPLGGVTAFGQDFAQLLNAVDKIEANLKTLIEKESSDRTESIKALKALMKTPSGSSASDATLVAQLESLQSEINILKQEIRLYQKGQPASYVSEQDIIDIWADIALSKAQIEHFKSSMDKNPVLIASLDNEGFYIPSKDDKLNNEEFESRLNDLEVAISEKQNEKTISNPSVKHGKISFGGMVNEHFTSGPDETSTFTSKRARLSAVGVVNDYAQIKIQVEFAKSPKLLDGKVTISPHQQWSLSVGQYQPPFGTDHLTPVTAIPFVNRSNTVGLYLDRDIGASLSFKQKFNSDYSLKLTAGMFNGSGINISDANNSKNFVARLESTLFGMFTLAPNVYFGKTNDVDSLKVDIVDFGSSLSWNWNQEKIELEYVRSEHGDIKRDSWYIWGGHMFSIESKFLPQLQLLARYEQHDANLSLTDDRVNRVTLGTNIYIDNKYTKIQLNYQINTEQGESISNNNFLMNFQLAF